jgi:transketolase C-terminal domain/subunit
MEKWLVGIGVGIGVGGFKLAITMFSCFSVRPYAS